MVNPKVQARIAASNLFVFFIKGNENDQQSVSRDTTKLSRRSLFGMLYRAFKMQD